MCLPWVTDPAHPLEQGARLAEDVRAAARSELGLVVSVGVAGNKLLAKLASRVAKPDGVHVVDGQALLEMLAGTPVERLPGERVGLVLDGVCCPTRVLCRCASVNGD